jgi:hypothetical protein
LNLVFVDSTFHVKHWFLLSYIWIQRLFESLFTYYPKAVLG